jgi:hypothetical protein
MDDHLLQRIDERLRSVSTRLDSLESQLINGIQERLITIEKKVLLLEGSNSTFLRWTDHMFKIVATLVAGYVCYRLGFPIH